MAKKFKSNSSQFLFNDDQLEQPKTTGTTAQEPATSNFYPDPRYIEKKSRRVQIVMKPSVYERAKDKIAGIIDENGRPLSFNDYIGQLVERDLEQ